MQPDVVELVYIIHQFKLQLLYEAEASAIYEFCLDHLEGRFGHSIIVRAALHARGSAELKTIEQLIDQGIVKLSAAIGMEQQDVEEAPFQCRKCLCQEWQNRPLESEYAFIFMDAVPMEGERSEPVA